MAKSIDKMTKDELLEYKKEVEKKLKEKEQAELLVANECKQIGFTALMLYAKNNADFAKDMVKALDQKLGTNEKKRLQNVIDELNSFIPAEPVKDIKDEKQQKENSTVIQSEQQKENPVVEQKQQEKPVAPVQQQNNSVAVGVQSQQPLTKFFNSAVTNV